MPKIVSILLTLLLVGTLSAGPLTPLPQKDLAYLQGVYADTWRGIDLFVHPATGLPYDSHDRSRPSTSITNIGFYMASCAVAGHTGLLEREKALEKITRALEHLARLEKWRGFPVTWVHVETLATQHQQFSTVDHLGNLTASLVLVRQLFPELEASVDAQLETMDWQPIYEPRNHYYRGGYRLDLQDFDIQQSWGEWYYHYLGADTRLGSFWGVASGQVPLAHWQALKREEESRQGQRYLGPGWQGGGLFMQLISGLFLDERSNALGESAAHFAYAQILHGREIGSPVWGWSAAVSPDGREYLGWGKIKDSPVTPHASAMAVLYYPREVIANLRALEKRGARAPFSDGGESLALGFRDALDWQTGTVAEGYLVLDQSMLFLSLANFLHDGVIWKAFQSHPVVQRGLRVLPEYAQTDPARLRLYRRRDKELSKTP